jgi:hypothetical protein
MLFLHEVHTVAGRSADDFEERFRGEWAPALGTDDEVRLLWFLHQAHGTGPSYKVVSVTAAASPAAWERLDARVRGGDLRAPARELDGLRHGLESKVLVPVEWSPLQTVDLAAVPIDGASHDQALFMEDTAWPHPGGLDDYLAGAGTLYLQTLERAEQSGRALLRLEAAFRPTFGAGRHNEVVLWQRVVRPELLLPLFTRDIPAEHRAPGTWMHDALDLRDRWESRLLRSARWSPLA